jgi:hypothetical protein
VITDYGLIPPDHEVGTWHVQTASMFAVIFSVRGQRQCALLGVHACLKLADHVREPLLLAGPASSMDRQDVCEEEPATVCGHSKYV